jgi:hypothetical protein
METISQGATRLAVIATEQAEIVMTMVSRHASTATEKDMSGGSEQAG